MRRSDTCTTFTVSAVDNSVEDAGRSIVLGFDRLPAGFSAKSPATATVDLVDDDTPPPSADLTIATGLVTCAATYISVTLADMSAGVEYTVYLRWRKSGDGWPSSPTHERRLSDSSPGGRADATVVLTDLDGDATYEVQASLDRAFASGVETVSFTTEAEEPDPPTRVRVTADTSTSITLEWVAPAYDGGDDITGYKVGWITVGQHFAAAALEGQQIIVNAADGVNTYTGTITGLDADTWYMVRVLAVNGAGDSESSNWASATTGAGPSGHGFFD